MTGARDEGICGDRVGSVHEVRHVARAIGKDFAVDADHDLRPMVPGKRCDIVVDRRLAADARAEGLAIETDEQEAHVGVAVDVAERTVHVVAVVLGVLEGIVARDLDEPGIPRTHRTVHVVLIARRDEEEARLFDQFEVLLPELEVEPMLFQAVGHAAAIEAILHLPHAVVIERRRVSAFGHAASLSELRGVFSILRQDKRAYPRQRDQCPRCRSQLPARAASPIGKQLLQEVEAVLPPTGTRTQSQVFCPANEMAATASDKKPGSPVSSIPWIKLVLG